MDRAKFIKEFSKLFKKNTDPENDPTTYNEMHPTDVYIMAARRADRPEVGMSKEQLEQLLTDNYTEGQRKGEEEVNKKLAEETEKVKELDAALKDFENLYRTEGININVEKIFYQANRRGYNKGYVEGKNKGQDEGYKLGIEDTLKETAFFKLQDKQGKYKPQYYDIFSINEMEKYIKAARQVDKEAKLPSGITKDSKSHEFARVFMRSLQKQITDAEKNEFVLLRGKEESDFKVSFGKQIAKLLTDHNLDPGKVLPTNMYNYKRMPPK
jgi:hypothetical protein